jgi:hypothetical protein
VLGGPEAVEVDLGGGVGHELHLHGGRAGREGVLHPVQNLGVELLGTECARVAGEHEADHAGLRAAEGSGGPVGAPVHLAGDLEHAGAGLLADAGAAVERERDGARRHPHPLGDVGDRRPVAHSAHSIAF